MQIIDFFGLAPSKYCQNQKFWVYNKISLFLVLKFANPLRLIIKLSQYESCTWHRFGAKIGAFFKAKLHNILRFKRAKMGLGSRPVSVRCPCVRPVSGQSLF